MSNFKKFTAPATWTNSKTNLLKSFIFKRDLWAPQSHFQCYFQGLASISKKFENLLRFGARPQPQPQRFCDSNRNCKAGYESNFLSCVLFLNFLFNFCILVMNVDANASSKHYWDKSRNNLKKVTK